MAKPFVVPGVCRFTVNGTVNQRPCANVVDYFVDTTGSTMSRDTACYNLAGVILNQWSSDIISKLNSNYQAQQVGYVDLNAPDGSVGARSVSGGNTWPKNGTLLNAPMVGNTAYLVRKLISGKRNARSGRLYLPGVGESDTDTASPNQILTAVRTALQTVCSSFLTTTAAESAGVGSYASWMVVTKITGRYPPEEGQEIGSPSTGISNRVTSLLVDPLLATQRRRLRS